MGTLRSFFFFQAEDGIRDPLVTGVQTCALPIFTGRSIRQELGEGWIISLHPDDSHRHLEAYADAFEKRQKSSSEYRLRRHDGQYRWMLDQSVPRFTDDGTFAG